MVFHILPIGFHVDGSDCIDLYVSYCNDAVPFVEVLDDGCLERVVTSGQFAAYPAGWSDIAVSQ